MRHALGFACWLGLALMVATLVTSCGGGAGRSAIVGLGNSGNRLTGEADLLDELAEALAESEGVPAVSNETVAEIFEAIVASARDGDPRAALIVLRTAEAQRENDES